MRTWQQQRREINQEVCDFFGRHIDIGPRAMSALQVGDIIDDYTDELPSGFAVSVIETLLKSSPAAATILFKSGVKIEGIDFPPTRNTPAILASITLNSIFKGVEAGDLVPTGKKVLDTGILLETDILMAALEAQLEGQEPDDFGYLMLEAARIKYPGVVRHDSAELWSECDSYLRRIMDRVGELSIADPSHSLTQFVLFEDEKKIIRVRPFGTTGISRLMIKPPIVEGQRYVYRGGVLQPVHTVAPELSTEIIELFEGLINSWMGSGLTK